MSKNITAPKSWKNPTDHINVLLSDPWYKTLVNLLSVFNENHKYLSFVKCLLRKRAIEEEPELFKIKGTLEI